MMGFIGQGIMDTQATLIVMTTVYIITGILTGMNTDLKANTLITVATETREENGDNNLTGDVIMHNHHMETMIKVIMAKVTANKATVTKVIMTNSSTIARKEETTTASNTLLKTADKTDV
jgi:hypothetical protein